jgi:hypothetical protein
MIHLKNKIYMHKQINYFNILIFKNKNEAISFSKCLNSLNINENTYILSLKSKLMNPHFKKK